MRVILDTINLLRGLIAPGGTSARLIDALLDRRFILISHVLHSSAGRTVEVDEGHRRMAVVDRLARVLFEVEPLDADPRRRLAAPPGTIDRRC